MDQDFDDNISEVTLVDNDLQPRYYIYFRSKPVDRIFIDLYSQDIHNYYHVFKRRENKKLGQINGFVQENDNDLMKTISRIFFENISKDFFNENEILSKNIFLMFLNSQQTEYKYKKCSLVVSIKIDLFSLKKRRQDENIAIFKKSILNI